MWGDKDADGFYWGECRGRRGYVPHNMVVEVSEQEATGQAAAKPRDRWTEAYATQPVRRMVAMYDYDPQELSPNVDADVSVVLDLIFVGSYVVNSVIEEKYQFTRILYDFFSK